MKLIWIGLLLVASPQRVFAHDDCHKYLTPTHTLIGNDRMGKSLEEIGGAADELFKAGGLIEQLGLSSRKQIIQFLSGTDLNILGSANHFPIGHWHDGAKMSQSRGGLIYEIAIPGNTERYSFYRDDNTLAQSISILMHVAGHVHFNIHSRWRQVRSVDLVQESYDLDRFMEDTRQEVGNDKVSEWYQFLLSLSWAQDIGNGTSHDDLKDLVYTEKGIARTPNILQSFIANLPRETPQWKIDMAHRFERLQRYIPGAVRTKIMNEGFATLLQEIIPKHSPYGTFDFGLQYCCLMAGVTAPSLSNPYWLGLEGWRNLYRRFQERPEIQSLSALEKDRAFIHWATESIISKMDDAEFLRASLDADWVFKHNFAIVRPLEEPEFDPDLTPDPDPRKDWQWGIVTRDPARVINSIVRQNKGFMLQHPRVEVIDYHDSHSGAILLDLSDNLGKVVALDKQSLIETLFVMSQIMNRRVALESTIDFTPQEVPPSTDSHFPSPRQEPETRKRRLKVVMNPNGTMEAYFVLRDGSDSPESLPTNRIFTDRKKIEYQPAPALVSEFKERLKVYTDNLTLDRSQEVAQQMFKGSLLSTMETQISDMVEGISLDLQVTVPTAPRAIHYYNEYVQKRLQKALAKALRDPKGLISSAKGLRVRALPNIPYFAYDSDSLQGALESVRPAPLPAQNLSALVSALSPDDHGQVVPVPGREGDRRWGPNPNGGGGAQGPGPGEPGQDPTDPSWIDVPLDLYAEALEEVVELPNLRPKGDKSLAKDEEESGHVQRRSGTAVPREIQKKAFRRGYVAEKQDQLDGKSEGLPPSHKILRRGLGELRPNEWFVRDTEPVKQPEINALVTFILDLSGSMNEFKPTARRMFYDLRAILMRKYKHLEFRFIAFDGKAYVFDDPDKFFKFEVGGGTSYEAAFKENLKVYEQFPAAKWDRFTTIIGDLEDFGGETESLLKQIIEESQFVAGFRTNNRPAGQHTGDLTGLFQSLHNSEDYFGFADVSPVESYTPFVFRKAFKNDEGK